MLIQIKRGPTANDATPGEMSIDGVFECYTLEDVVREVADTPVADWKIVGQTAIPRGKYKVSLSMSGHFDRILPLIENVPGFSGVRIHSGNKAADTEGCILVGAARTHDLFQILDSRKAAAALQAKIQNAIDQRISVYLEIA